MGVRVILTYYAPNDRVAEQAGKAAYRRFEDLEQIMSDYRSESEIRRLPAKASQDFCPVSPDLWRILRIANEISEASNGAFDVTVGPIVKLWRQARQTGQFPSQSSIQAARAKTGFQHILFADRGRRIRIDQAGVLIDLGGIAKGYACDAAIDAMKKFGVNRAMVEAGGDIAVGEAPPGRNGWRLQVIGSDQATLNLRYQGVSTSGDLEQFVEIGGVKYSHIVDPKTGLGVTNRRQATVIARKATLTDALATTFCIVDDATRAKMEAKFHVRSIIQSSRD